MKQEKQKRAKYLRKKGISLRKIAEDLNISLSSASVWTRDVKLTSKQKENLKNKNPIFSKEARKKASKQLSKTYKNKRIRSQKQGRLKAKENDAKHQAGCMLYWAEGSKSRNAVVFCNSDIEMMKFFLVFLREYYNVPNEDCSLYFNCHLNNGMSLKEVQQKWLTELDLPKECLRSSVVKMGETKKGKLPYGICTLNVNKTSIVQQIYGAIQEYASFSRPNWL